MVENWGCIYIMSISCHYIPPFRLGKEMNARQQGSEAAKQWTGWMARELKIPAEGGGWRRSRWEEACGGLTGTVGDVLGAGDVLDEIYVMRVVVLLVHALAGSSLALELSPLWRAWLVPDGGKEQRVISDKWQQAGRSEATYHLRESLRSESREVWGDAHEWVWLGGYREAQIDLERTNDTSLSHLSCMCVSLFISDS